MIRFLFLLIVFFLGLAGAALWKGQMHHLRLAVPEQLPAWTAPLPDDAGVLDGHMVVPLSGLAPIPLPAPELSWRAMLPGAEGLRWRVRLKGQGLDLDAELLLPWRADRALLRNGGGTLDLAAASGSVLQGLVVLEALEGELADLTGARRPSGTLAAHARGLALEGAALGEGPLTARLDEDGAWALAARLAGGVSAAEATVTGRWPSPSARLTGFIADAAALPPRARHALQPVASPEGSGLRIDMPIGAGR